MENKLRLLYALQKVDLHLDELEELKGDLPKEVNECENKVSALQSHLSLLEQTMRTAFMRRDEVDSEILSVKEKLERYKSQQFEVRNNKEYDALSREMDHAVNSIQELEKEMASLENKATTARTDIETMKTQLAELETMLAQKREALAQVSQTTEEEENMVRHEREKLVARINKADLAAYERIRKAKKGKAVVTVRRGACGGCFAKVPPQKLLELRRNNTLYTCEHCGRIIVSEEIAEANAAVV